MEQSPKRVSVLVASFPGLTVDVPYRVDEPLKYTLDRVTSKLFGTDLGNSSSSPQFDKHSLHIDGLLIDDYSKSLRQYSIFGDVLTYQTKTTNPVHHGAITFIDNSDDYDKDNGLDDDDDDIPCSIHILTVYGSNFTVNMRPARNTVEELQQVIFQRIKSFSALLPSQLHLFVGGAKLENKDYLLSQYHITAGTTIHLLLPSPSASRLPGENHLNTSSHDRQENLKQLFVVILTGKTIVCHIRLDQTVSNLKSMVEAKTGVPVENQRIVYMAKQLQEDQTLAYYNISAEATLHLVPRLRGGDFIAPIPFADVSNDSNRRKIFFSKNAPRGRMAGSGINVEVRCKCTGGYRVISMKRFDLFELNDTLTPCPNCNSTNVTQVTVGFVRCHYRIHGIKYNGTRYRSDWTKVTEDDQYQLYDPTKQTTWKRLGIEAKPLTVLTGDDPCTICLEVLDQNLEDVTTLSCSHQYHLKCIKAWNLTCPNCRASFTRL